MVMKKTSRFALWDQVLDLIRIAIVKGRFSASEEFPEEKLASQIGVSRTPIRDAIRILEQQGIVKVLPKDGTYVASFGSEDIKDGLLVRVSLEQSAVKQSVERLSDHQWSRSCRRLNKLLDSVFAAAEKMNAMKSMEFYMEWHTVMVDVSRNKNLSKTWR